MRVTLKEIVEVGLVPRGRISAPRVAEEVCAGMFECAKKEEWLDGSAVSSELHDSFCADVPLVSSLSRNLHSSDIHAGTACE